MAKLLLAGEVATVELTRGEDETLAVCQGMHTQCDGQLTHGCLWTERYDTMDDAVEYAADHADRGAQ